MPTAGFKWNGDPVLGPAKLLGGLAMEYYIRQNGHHDKFFADNSSNTAYQMLGDLYPDGLKKVEQLFTGERKDIPGLIGRRFRASMRSNVRTGGGEIDTLLCPQYGPTFELAYNCVTFNKPISADAFAHEQEKIILTRDGKKPALYVLIHPKIIEEAYIGQAGVLESRINSHSDMGYHLHIAVVTINKQCACDMERWVHSQLSKYLGERVTGHVKFPNGTFALDEIEKLIREAKHIFHHTNKIIEDKRLERKPKIILTNDWLKPLPESYQLTGEVT